MSAAQAPADTRVTGLDRRIVLKLLGAGTSAMALASVAMPPAVAASQSGPRHARAGTALRQQVAAYVAAARFEDLPPAAIEKAKEQIVFFFGRAFASALTGRARQALDLVQPTGCQSADASVIGNRLRLAPADAALVNATLFGESLPPPMLFNEAIHPGVITLPAALATGEVRCTSGRELLLALAVGYEVMGRLGQAVSSTCRATTIVATYAATAAAGRLMGLDRERMATALEYAAGSCMELGRGEVYPALISRNGLLAAHLAQADVLADVRDASDAEPSTRSSPFADAATDLPDSIDELGYWEILTTLPRPYRSTGHDTAAAELLADLIESHRLTEHCVSAIQVALPASGSRLLDSELAAQGPFKPTCRACWSVPYSLARVLADGGIDTARFADEHIVGDRAVARLMQTIDVTFERGCGARWARVTVHTRDGRRLERESDFFTYELPPHMWHDWLRAGGKRLLPGTQLRELTRLIRDLETVGDVSLLLAAARPSQSTAQS